MLHFEIDRSKNGRFVWRLRAAKGETISSGESYTTKENCKAAIDRMKAIIPSTPVHDLTRTTELMDVLQGKVG